MDRLARPRRFALAAVLCSAVVVSLPPSPAYAAPLPDGTVQRPKSSTVYELAADRPAWAAVAVYSPNNWNASLLESTGAWLASSTYPAGRTEFIAVNSHLRGVAAYRAEATRITGYSPYMQWRQATAKIVLPVPANDGVSGPGDPDLAFAWLDSRDVVNVYDMHLNYGDMFWVNATPDTGFYFLPSNPYDPATFLRTRAQSVGVPGMRVVGNCTLYRAGYTGWHGVLVVSDTAPVTTVPAGGIALALHRYDPARPVTCPQRNFPDPTPAGP
ncbi:hypothetical protein Cme02nite_03680 [Catellatospora methionotrophica]|uniref:Uncharacterized protein n=1 Tax=Catellatospora methionotrophica TaxID=121620 RepID=A0A8J3LBK7_9ACTN|nr:hypothetical protein [Catellatospora methionotrophica]GIG12036.1 hypothetical protein Cme02nite_03680 [Catellatospora methionotrophica]